MLHSIPVSVVRLSFRPILSSRRPLIPQQAVRYRRQQVFQQARKKSEEESKVKLMLSNLEQWLLFSSIGAFSIENLQVILCLES